MSDTVVDLDENEGGVGHVQLLKDRRFISVLSICFLASMGTNIAAAALPSITAAFGISDSSAGLIITVYTLPAMVFVPISGILADMHGRRPVLVPCLFVYGAAGGAIMFANSFLTVLSLRALQGVAIAGIAPVAITVIGDLYSSTTGTTAQGLRVAAMGIGGVSLPVIVGFLSGISWAIPFGLYAFGIFVGLFTYWALPETAADRSTETGIWLTIVAYWRSLRSEITRVNTLVLISGGFARDFVRYGLITFLPLFAVRSLGASYVAAGAILGIRGVAYIVISPLSGILSDFSSSRSVLISSMLLCGVFALSILAAPSVEWVILLFGIYAIGDAAFSPVLKDTVTSSTTAEHRSGVISGMNTLKYAGQTLGPAFFGLVLAAFGFTELFVIAGVIAAGYGLTLAVVLGDV